VNIGARLGPTHAHPSNKAKQLAVPCLMFSYCPTLIRRILARCSPSSKSLAAPLAAAATFRPPLRPTSALAAMSGDPAPVTAVVTEAEAVVSEAALLVEVDVTPPRKRGRPRKDVAASNAAQPVTALVEVATVAVAVAAAQTPPSTGKKKAGRRPASPSELVLTDQAALQYKAGRIAELLARLYPNPPIPLDHGSTFQLLCAVLLSAQVCAFP
jgi:hypothetical protein